MSLLQSMSITIIKIEIMLRCLLIKLAEREKTERARGVDLCRWRLISNYVSNYLCKYLSTYLSKYLSTYLSKYLSKYLSTVSNVIK